MYYKSYQIRASLRGRTGNKYGAKRTAGFDSKKEWLRYQELLLLEKAGEVKNIEKQKAFELRGENGNLICKYKADFVYVDNGVRVIEDVKSPITCTPYFKLKWKLLEDKFKDEISRGEIKLFQNFSR